jgi:hypothetical protein
MVAEQRETVQRIDADTLDIASNVSGAHRELMKYYAGISSNRWLMLKVFGVLIVFVSHGDLSHQSVVDRQAPVPYFYTRFWLNTPATIHISIYRYPPFIMHTDTLWHVASYLITDSVIVADTYQLVIQQELH